MYSVGDLIIYSSHGICEIDDITEKSFSNQTKTYYVMHPINDSKLVINVPIHSDKINLQDVVNKATAEKIIDSFKHPGVDWIEKNNHRIHIFSEAIKNGDRFEIAKIVNTLMVKQHDNEFLGKKLGSQDMKLLTSIQNILFSELALSLETTSDEIYNRVVKSLQHQF
ncbi:CarD family transcriptional regulator [Ureibacillus manganicus]|uniref:CarD family transcriptional regulator n=1 Tax=Ureibacillus manganicus DSM 26584 TaxID=1384049 RepID=A0A0A3I3K6_9BACL|nr:CarD family transcriptional regulator [Ureibacillus manganicus]KGR79376.1 CarD family transcriptional regulator [Ureibacillus manganicus DSM 26584]